MFLICSIFTSANAHNIKNEQVSCPFPAIFKYYRLKQLQGKAIIFKLITKPRKKSYEIKYKIIKDNNRGAEKKCFLECVTITEERTFQSGWAVNKRKKRETNKQTNTKTTQMKIIPPSI